jgi:signal transduction histidine kinase
VRPLPSLRARVLCGACLWTVGLCIGAVLVTTVLMLRYPHFHRYLETLHGAVDTYAAALSVLVILCMVVGFFHVRKALSPLNQLRTRLAAVHAGDARTLEGRYPNEVQPLVDDVNALLDHREQMVRRALTKAGDLAHGLKTPLAVLAEEAQGAAATGHHELAASIEQQVERMRRQMDYHLAHARAAASGAAPGAGCRVVESADGLARTLKRLHAGRGVEIRVEVPADHVVRAQREDVDEMLGNLFDNACKWAKSLVRVSSAETDGRIRILVEDDGQGIAAPMRDAVLQRGVRADEAAPGTGFGLAIVRDLVELYGGSISLNTSPLGGLRAELELPCPK